MRRAISSLLIASFAVAATTLAVLALPTQAQTPPSLPMHASMHSPERMAEHQQKRLDKLEKKLNLQASQQAAWATYKSSVLAAGTERAAKMKQTHEEMQKKSAADMSAPQRMEERAKHLREQADAMSRHAQQTQALYQVLTPEQRTIMDLMSERGMHHGLHAMRGAMGGALGGAMGGGMRDMNHGGMPKGAPQR
jgi:LTXXQ motif family protein